MPISTHVGLDVHKNSIFIAVRSRSEASARSLGQIPHDLTRLLRKLAKLGPPESVQLCYEAGPTGYGLCRALRKRGYDCQVVAPAKTPSIVSNRVKTDRRDALKLADFLATGHLTSIRIPTPEEEALRDLIRAREDLKIKETNSKRQLNSMMLRHGRVFSMQNGGGKSHWTLLHLEWLDRQRFEHEASNIAKETYIAEIRHLIERIETLDSRIAEIAEAMERADLIRALQAFKGIKVLTAATIVAEIGDLRRFPTAKRFASFLGLTPSEQSSGETRNRGSITKAGNRRLRRMLVEAAWAYWRSPHISRELLKRSEGTSESVRAIAWKAQSRLNRRLRALQHRHVPMKKALIAVARELACAIWAVGQEEPLAA
ncbi:MAG: IS110 family transposase [Pseudomonadota bacterium]